MVADLGMNGISKIDGRCACGQRYNFALRREHQKFGGIELAAHGIHKFFGIFEPALQFHDLADPRHALIERRGVLALFFILPVRRDTVFRRAVHLFGADLNFEGLPEVGDDGGMQRLIQVGFGRGDIILDAPRNGFPLFMDLAEHLVTFVHRPHDHAYGGEIVNLIERLVLGFHLFIDRIKVLRAPEDLAHNAALGENAVDFFDNKIDETVAFFQLLMDILDEILEGGGFEVFKAQIFELALDLRNTQSARDRRVDIKRFVRHFSLPFRRKKIERTHIMQAVGKFDDNDADILRHGDEYLAEVFRFRLFFRLEHDFIEFGHARNKLEHLVAEFAAHVLFVRLGILDDVVQERGGDRRGVQP